MVKQFVSEVLEGTITVARDTEAMINARIAQIDALISAQLNEVMHHPDLQKLEGSWRGLKYMLNQSETNDMMKIKIFNVSKKELLKDLQKAPEFDQSALFKKVYEEEYGVFGGAPFGALLGDYEFGKSGQDLELLEKISNVAAAAPPVTDAVSWVLPPGSRFATELGAIATTIGSGVGAGVTMPAPSPPPPQAARLASHSPTSPCVQRVPDRRLSMPLLDPVAFRRSLVGAAPPCASARS
jgi:hypothetical protein